MSRNSLTEEYEETIFEFGRLALYVNTLSIPIGFTLIAVGMVFYSNC